jgi:hypothetical protein
MHVLGKGQARYDWFKTSEFKAYLDQYAAFLKRYGQGIDFYVTVDVIFNPELSWKSLKYLEEKHGLSPVPVIHDKTPLKWLDKHIEAGYDFIGIGGMGQDSTKQSYKKWTDSVFDRLCSFPDRKPRIKTHGFAVTSYDLMIRYPFYSVDSSSWAKAAGFGSLFVPHKRNGAFTFGVAPYQIGMSHRSKTIGKNWKHFYHLTSGARAIVLEWLKIIDVPLGTFNKDGTVKVPGALSTYNPRALANARFFEKLCEWLPKWPWAFKPKTNYGRIFQ